MSKTAPRERTRSPFFSSGPCKKHPLWPDQVLSSACVSRSHRSLDGLKELKCALDELRQLHEIPDDYKIAFVTGSATGAMEMLMWSLLGARPLELLVWDVFGRRWQDDLLHQLKDVKTRVHSSDHGELPDLGTVDFQNDVLFLWNGSTAGVKVPNADWIPDDRKGLVICDATSSAFAMHMPWEKLDAVGFSWQKGIGGEAAHGTIVLSPRAIDHINQYTPKWPIPGLFRLRQDGKLLESLFEGMTLNTPSMLCVGDLRLALKWGRSVGGLDGLVQRSLQNFSVLSDWIEKSSHWRFLARDPLTRSNTTVCIQYHDEWFSSLETDKKWLFYRGIGMALANEKIAYDIVNHVSAVPALRIWCGPTIDADDVRVLTQWIDYFAGIVLSDLKISQSH